jgi:hypothetical protein
MKFNLNKKWKPASGMKTGFVAILGSLILALIFWSCDVTNPMKDIAVIFNSLSINTTASVSIVDAATGMPIGSSSLPKSVTLTFSGPDAAKIVNASDQAITSLSTTYGVAAFGITTSYTPTSASPVRVTVVASAAGYQTTSMPLVFSSTGSVSSTVSMVNIASPPTGTSTAPTTPIQANTSGQTSATVAVKTSVETSSHGSAGLTINSGTGITDANGNALTGALSANITYFSGSNGISSGALPTGLSVGFIDPTNSSGQGFIQPAAFASFTITNQNGQQAKQFSTPVTVSMTIPGNTINPLTNQNVKNNDVVPIYSFNEASQVWQFEVNSSATGPDATGNFTLTFPISHLSNWLAGWISSGGKVCTNNFTLNITGSYTSLLLKMKLSGTTILTSSLSSNANSYTLRNVTVPKGVPVTIEAYSLTECPATLVGSTTVTDLCSTNNVSLNVNQGGNITDVDVDVTAFCPHKDPVLQVKPSGYEIFILSPCGNLDVGTLNKGHITLHGLKLGSTYTFGMIYKNTLYTQDYTVDQNHYTFNYNIPDDVCDKDFK